MPEENNPIEAKQAKLSVLVIIVGATLFMIGTTVGRDSHIVTALSILGSVVFLVGTFTLLLVLIGVTNSLIRKPRSRRAQCRNQTDTSGLSFRPDSLPPYSRMPPEERTVTASTSEAPHTSGRGSQGQTETPVIPLPVCPKIVVPVQVQPPPTYEEAIAMSKRSEIVPRETDASTSHNESISYY